MRTAFVSLQTGEMTGVSHAIEGQAAATRALGLPIDFWVVSSAPTGERAGIHFAQLVGPLGPRSAPLFKSRLVASVEALDAYDTIILRYPGGLDLDPLALFRRCRARIITVHHTQEVAEVLSAGKTAANVARAALEWANGRRILARVHGVVGVTDEIRRYELARARRQLPSRTIANGIHVEGIKQTGFVPFGGDELKLLFIGGAHAPWHGTDRLLASLRRYRGPTRVLLHMVGAVREGTPGDVREGPLTVRYHGTLKGAALDAVFKDTTLAFSSLAMFRNGLQEGCVLKTREYVARGLPFIYGYTDVDLPEGLDFCRRVPNDDSLIDVEQVLDFARHVTKHPELSTTMRAFAHERLDWKVKMREFFEFASAGA